MSEIYIDRLFGCVAAQLTFSHPSINQLYVLIKMCIIYLYMYIYIYICCFSIWVFFKYTWPPTSSWRWKRVCDNLSLDFNHFRIFCMFNVKGIINSIKICTFFTSSLTRETVRFFIFYQSKLVLTSRGIIRRKRFP